MLGTPKSCLKVSVISLILIFSLTEVSQSHPHHSYSHDWRRTTNNPFWMTALKDDLRLSELSIPGTHDSMALHAKEGLLGGVSRDLIVTQSMPLNLQLESGIRVLDIRCAITGNSFKIYHGNIYQRANFDDVLDMVVAFLRNHRGETVLLRVKEENTNDPKDFERIFRESYWNTDKYKSFMWNVPTIPETSQNPTLGELRGKIVILQDFARWQCSNSSSKAEFGLCYNSFKIQDEFQLDGDADLYNKWEKVKKHLEDANNIDTPENNAINYMNYLSGSSKGASSLGRPFPFFVVSGHISASTSSDRKATDFRANPNPTLWPDFPRLRCGISTRCIFYEGTNTLVYGGIRTGYYTRRIGIIMTDFPGGGLINRIICINFPRTNRCWR